MLRLIELKIDKYEKLSKGKYRLYLDNGEVIDTYDDVILKHDLLIKKEINLSIYDKIQKDNIIYENYVACLKYITVRIRSTKEIVDYLKRKKISCDDIDIIVERLKKENLLNDEYFAKCFINDKFKFTTWGNYRIKNELKKHNIDIQIIDKYLSDVSYDQLYEKLDKLVDKQIRANHKLSDIRLKNKIYHNLMNLGYESNMILDLLNQKL